MLGAKTVLRLSVCALRVGGAGETAVEFVCFSLLGSKAALHDLQGGGEKILVDDKRLEILREASGDCLGS